TRLWDQAGERWTTLSGDVWREARGLLRVTRIDHPEAALIAPEQSFFLRENLKLRLLNARLALLSRQFDTAQVDLREAQAMLDRYFDARSRKLTQTTELLRQVQGQSRQVTVPRPDDTLAALSAVAR
ncbi:uroporphyrinogen-III C-methyltransferase, partial [Roseateles sp.]|uniref:uroporphyrinogen-III C-methyltransferase n=1 Tax=Roseateles sp. TaxID=1971397 RepID=UPI002F3FE589